MTARKIKYRTNEYVYIHSWLRKNFGKASVCENKRCVSKEPKKFHWAVLRDKDYEYKRENFIQLCVKCHANYDVTDEKRNATRLRMTGKKFSKSTKSKMSSVRLGKQGVPVRKYSKTGIFLSEYRSITDAAKDTGILRSSISNVLIGISNYAGGFIWKYKSRAKNKMVFYKIEKHRVKNFKLKL